MYSSVAIASIVAVFIQIQQMRKNEVNVPDVYARLAWSKINGKYLNVNGIVYDFEFK